MRLELLLSYFIEEKIEAYRGKVTGSRPHNPQCWVMNHNLSDSRVYSQLLCNVLLFICERVTQRNEA